MEDDIRKLLRWLLWWLKPQWEFIVASYDGTPAGMTMYLWDDKLLRIIKDDGSVEEIPTEGMEWEANEQRYA